ncbi:MAG TPA: hypothetical protein PLK12_05070 [Prolixibacteraceae bacterium]|nr:hypothetical protein [Prolixibacteraceae bacterium]
MKLESAFSYTGLFLLIFLALAAGVAYLIYFFRKEKEVFGSIQRVVLAAIRLIYLFLILFLVISPIIEMLRIRIEKPILILGVDNSASLGTDSSSLNQTKLLTDQLLNRLNDKFSIEPYTFGEQVTPNGTLTYSEKTSNYSNLIDEIEKRYFNLNVGAIVFVGDGIFNEGKNPEQEIQKLLAPVYTVGLGDTLTGSDQALIGLNHNPNVFQGNTFPLQIEALFTRFVHSSSQITVYSGDRIVFREQINVPQPDYYYQREIQIQADSAGFQTITVLLSPYPNESNTANNRGRFTIEVHDNKYKVLILTQSPHPDIGALSETLRKQANFQVSTSLLQDFSGNINEYDLLVLNQLPSTSIQEDSLFRTLANSNQSVLILVGPNTSLPALNNLNMGCTFAPAQLTQESTPSFHESFSLFLFPPSLSSVSEAYPPLLTWFTQYDCSPDFSVVAYQKINSIVMNYPLILAGEREQRKTGFIMGEGLWRWKLYEYQNFENQNVFDNLMVNFFTYLCLREERESFTIKYEKLAIETQPYRIKAQLFDELFEPVVGPEIRLHLIDSSNAELNYLFDSDPTGYHLNMGYLKPGFYRFKATTQLGEEDLTSEGSFTIQEVNIEQENLRANHALLKKLSSLTGGSFYYPTEADKLINRLESDRTIEIKEHEEKSRVEIIDWKIVAAILMVLLSLEWFLRKFWGSY